MKLKSISKNRLLATAVESLRSRIMSELHEGDSLPSEGELAVQLGVSRTIIREAMRMLEARGLVDIGQGRSARVKAGNADAAAATIDVLLQQGKGRLLDLVEVRMGLEGEVCSLAAKRANQRQIEQLQQAIDRQESAGANLSGMIEADMRFHELLVECTGNIIFKVLLAPLTQLLYESRRKTLSQFGSSPALVAHRQILEAIKRHSPAAARKAMLDHLDMAQSNIKEGK